MKRPAAKWLAVLGVTGLFALFAGLSGSLPVLFGQPAALAQTGPQAAPGPDPQWARSAAVATRRAASLGPGINMWRWFRRPGPHDAAYYRDFASDAELRQLRAWGFRSLRLPLGEPFLLPGGTLSEPSPAALATLRGAVDRINAAGLVAVVDFHPENAKKHEIEGSPDQQRQLVALWRRLATTLAQTDPDQVLFEPLNEPHYKRDPAAWNALAQRLVSEIRKVAPDHTIVIDTVWAGDPEKLEEIDGISDGNVIYSPHVYFPAYFTTQGSQNQRPFVDGLVFPATDASCRAARAAARQATAAQPARQSARQALGFEVTPTKEADEYCSGTAGLDATVARLADWSRRTGKPLWIGEFGVSARGTDRADRLAWLAAARQSFARHGVPASLWSYDDCWGLAMRAGCDADLGQGKRGRTTAEHSCATLAALQLGGPGCVGEVRRLAVALQPGN